MPDSPEHTQDIYTVLANLRDALANTTQVTTYCLDLKASSDRFLPLIAMSLRLLNASIEQALPLLLTAEDGQRNA